MKNRSAPFSVPQDTAHRDILDLIRRDVLRKDSGGGRSTSYSLVLDASMGTEAAEGAPPDSSSKAES